MERVPLTKNGHEKLSSELSNRLHLIRNRIIENIQEARAHGDLKENAEYHSAKEEQSMNEGRILILESLLSRSEIIDPDKIDKNKVSFVSTVEILDVDTLQIKQYQIVSEHESDISLGMISNTSPIARAIIGKYVNDEIDFTAPNGTVKYIKINKIF